MDFADRLAMQPGGLKDLRQLQVAFSCDSLRRHITEEYLLRSFGSECAIHFYLDGSGPM